MVRPARTEDIPMLLPMALAFLDALDEHGDTATITGTLENMINADQAVVIVGDHSMLGGIVVPHFFDATRSMATELFWWVEPQARGAGEGAALLKSFESWARASGASRVVMVSMASLSETVGKMYEAHGYTSFESSYLKEL